MKPTPPDGVPATTRSPGWPAVLGPVRTSAGLVLLRPPRLRDARAWSSARLRDRAYLQRWEPTSGAWSQRNTRRSWLGQWATLRSMGRRGMALSFALTVDDVFAGQLTLGNVVRGALRSAWVGYWVTERLAGHGIGTAAVALAADHGFGPVGLHRVEATVRPENAASIRVLEKAGFRREGLFERYLDVAGAWRDHYVYALTSEEFTDGVVVDLVRKGHLHLP